MRKLTGVIVFVAAVSFFGATCAIADIYKWTGRDGTVHITDDIRKVPEDLRNGVSVYKTRHPEVRPETERPKGIPATKIEKQKPPELYGDYTLEWWKEQFDKLRQETDIIMVAIDTKERFIKVFEGGRRFGQVFGEDETATYERYKKELASDKDRLKELEDEFAELTRKAKIHGVPKYIREE